MKILIVEDEVKLTEALAFLFKKQKIDVEIANDGEEGMIMAQKDVYDVIVLDIMLPIINGLEILKRIRGKGVKTPVLILTAKDTIDDKVIGLDAGADDYLVKPFATQELIARVKALSRRKDIPFVNHDIHFNDIAYNPDRFEMTVKGVSSKVPKKEGDLIELLITRPNQVFTRDQIVDRLWGLDSDVLENNIEIYIHHLRKRLEDADTKIETIRGVGYILKEK